MLVVEPEPGTDDDELRDWLRRELRTGDCRIHAAAQPDVILVMALPEMGRALKVNKAALRALAQERLECA